MSTRKEIHLRTVVGRRVRIDLAIFNRDNATGAETPEDPSTLTVKAYRPGATAETLTVVVDGTGERHVYVDITSEAITEVEALTDESVPDGLKGVGIYRIWADPKVS